MRGGLAKINPCPESSFAQEPTLCPEEGRRNYSSREARSEKYVSLHLEARKLVRGGTPELSDRGPNKKKEGDIYNSSRGECRSTTLRNR